MTNPAKKTARKAPAKPTKKAARKAATKTAKPKSAASPVIAASVDESKSESVYVLRCVPPNMRTTRDFLWPESGSVECSDWKPTAECGNGLHGWLWGEGDLSASGGVWEMTDAKWLVVRVAKADVVDLGGKVKFPRGEVVFCGTREAAANRICELGAVGAVHFRTATAGTRGTATAGYAGTATAGDEGIVAIRWYDEDQRRYRLARGLVGENGIEANVAYVVRDGKFVRKDLVTP